MNISDFGYQRLVQQIERVTALCVNASSRTKVPQTLRDIRTIGTEAEEIKIILNEFVKPDPPKGGGKKSDKPSSSTEAEPSSAATAEAEHSEVA